MGNRSFSSSTPSARTFLPIEREYIRNGFVAGLGADIPLKALHILPEMRYTRWLSPEKIPLAEDSDGTTSNSIEILLGFRFGGKAGHVK